MPGFIYLSCITTRIADPAATAKIFRCGRAPRIVPLTAIRPTLAFILGLLAIAVAVAIFIFPTAAVIVATRPVLISVALVPVAVATFPTTIIRTTALAGITPLIAAAIASRPGDHRASRHADVGDPIQHSGAGRSSSRLMAAGDATGHVRGKSRDRDNNGPNNGRLRK